MFGVPMPTRDGRPVRAIEASVADAGWRSCVRWGESIVSGSWSVVTPFPELAERKAANRSGGVDSLLVASPKQGDEEGQSWRRLRSVPEELVEAFPCWRDFVGRLGAADEVELVAEVKEI
jgi:hypothetical protein